jgi:23S rRNA (cytosine1962-C5)-methyltransferase
LVTPALFQSIVAGAAADAKRNARVLEKLTQPPDHPILLTFPESEYLKGLICEVE